MAGELSYRIVDGPIDLDVTAHLLGAPELSWNAIGGCETARLKIDLPLSTFPTLGRRSRLIVTDQMGRGVWDGYCTDPGGLDDEGGESFDLTADGSMSAASLRVGRLVYADTDPNSWTRARGSATTGQASVDSDTNAWTVAHPQGYLLGTGAAIGIEYRPLEHSDQGIGRVAFTLTGGAIDPGFVVRITTWADGVLVDTIDKPFTTVAADLVLVAGTDIATGCDVIRVSLVRTGTLTNNTTPLSFITVSGLVVNGGVVDQWGNPVAAGGTLTSARVIADLIGRGMLGPVDPDAAVITASAAVHPQLSWATGIRGAAALEELRKLDPDMTWMYGVRGPDGYRFEWVPWAVENTTTGDLGVRYDLTHQDVISSTGSTDLPADRVLVIWTDVDGDEHSLLVEIPSAADDEYARDLDPLVLGETTEAAATEAGLDALTRAQQVGRTVTVTVSRQVLDRATGLLVEPYELRPGCLARLEATGEILRVQGVAAKGGDSGGTADLTLGDPAQTLEDRLLAVVRGEVDPAAPLVPLPPKPETPPVNGVPVTTDGEPPSMSPTVVWQQGIGSLFLTWLPVANADPVEYRVLIGTSPSLVESEATLAATVQGTFYVARTLPSGAAFVAGTTYYARVIAADADGDADPGPVASGTVLAKIVSTQITDGAVDTPQLNANAITGDLLIANDAWIDALHAIDLFGESFTGAIFQTLAATNRGIKMSGPGNFIKAWDNLGNLTFTLDGSTGLITAKGADLQNGTITGALIRTSATGLRAVLETVSTTGGLNLYNGSTYLGGLQGGTLFGSPVTYLLGPSGAGGTEIAIDSTRIWLLGPVNATDGGNSFAGSFSGTHTGSFSGSASGSWTGGDITTGTSDAVRHHSLDKPGGGTGNAYVYAGASGLLSRGAEITSKREAKIDVVPLEIDPDAWAGLGVYRFRYPGSEHESAGFMLNEFQAAGFDLWIATDEDGEPGGLHYSHVTVGHQAMLRDHHPRIAELEERDRAKDELIEHLIDRIEQIEARLPGTEASGS